MHKLKFYFIHVNWFYRREVENTPGDFCPAEFAVAEFTMEHGVSRTYHEILYIKSATGYTREALENSQNSHKIPLELANGEKDFALMYDKLIEFLRPEDNANKLPPLFTLETFNTLSVKNPVHSLLRKMSETRGCKCIFVEKCVILDVQCMILFLQMFIMIPNYYYIQWMFCSLNYITLQLALILK